MLSQRWMTGAAWSTLCPVNRDGALWRATSAQICVLGFFCVVVVVVVLRA